MRFASYAIGILLHSHINHNSYADAFSSPTFQSQLTLANRNGFSPKTLARGRPSKHAALKSSGGLPDGFEWDEDSVSEEELSTLESSILHHGVDR
jgi:hypothetical protein